MANKAIKIFLIVGSLLAAGTSKGLSRFQGWSEQGGRSVTTGNLVSTTKVQQSFPASTVTVYQTGTTTLASIYVDSAGSSLKANPFTADSTGFWFFYTSPTTVDVKFSGTGITTPFTVTYSTGSGADVSVVAPAPSGGDDYAVLQAILTANAPLGSDIVLRCGVYLVSAELQDPLTSAPFRLRGCGQVYNSTTAGTIIQGTTLGMRSVLAVRTQQPILSDLKLDGNRLATSAGYIQNANLGATITNVWYWNAKFDGLYLDGDNTHFNDNLVFIGCGWASNGTTYTTSGISSEYLYGTKSTIAGTAATIAANPTITISGGPDLTTLGIRKGDFVRVGAGTTQSLSGLTGSGTAATATTATAHGLSDSQIVTIAGAATSAFNGSFTITVTSPTTFTYACSGVGAAGGAPTVRNPQTAQFIQIESVTSTTIVAQVNAFNAPTATVAGADYAIGVGDGYHEVRSNNNNSTQMIGCTARSNGGSGAVFAGLFGPRIVGSFFDFGNWFGVVLGYSDNSTVTYQTSMLQPYFESLMAGGVWFGQVVDPTLLSPTRSNTVHPWRGIFQNNGWIIGENIESLLSGTWQNFDIDIKNNGGTIQHRILAEIQNANASSYAARINNAASGYTTTPTVDNVTPFAAGGGILSSNKGVFVFDTGIQTNPAFFAGQASLEQNTTGTAYVVRPDIQSFNINGVTQNRLVLYVFDLTGAGLDLTTIAAGKQLTIRFSGYVK